VFFCVCVYYQFLVNKRLYIY